MSDNKKNKVWTIKKVLFWTSDYFKKHNIDSPKFNAEMIMSKILNLSRVKLYLHYDEVLPAKKLAQIKKFIKKRADHYPLQYLLGETEFYGHKIYVNEGVLIPRPETEVLVDAVVTYLKNSDKRNCNILDLGTGTGVIPISIHKYFEDKDCDINFTVTDVLSASLKNAERNFQKYDMNNVKLIESDLLEKVDAIFDIITSNPPYIAEEDWDDLPLVIKDHEPKQALLAGERGLKYYKSILSKSRDYLKDDARVFLEIGAEQAEYVMQLADKHSFEVLGINKDFNDRDRVMILKMKE